MKFRPNGFNLSFNLVLAAIALAFASTSFAGDLPQSQRNKGKTYQIAIDFAKGSQVRVS